MSARTTASQMRAWQGPALLNLGFRPFFLGAGLWALVSMGLWIGMLMGHADLPTTFTPVDWHAHAFLFGYLGAVIAGFLLTAVPNWTGRLPVVGWPLAALALLWIAGRIAVATSALWPEGAALTIDLAFPLTLAAVILREIIVGRNWRNLPVLALLATFALANLMFHVDARAGAAAQGPGLRLGVATVVMMIGLIGGRIVPSFTRNWLAGRGDPARPAPPMQPFDKITLAATLPALGLWTVLPDATLTALALIAVAVLHTVRLLRWQGRHTGAEPLVWVLHAGYAFVPLGALCVGAAILAGSHVTAAQHLWMSGAFGLMTLAVMTRATLGHTGNPLTSGPSTTVIYAALIAATLVRVIAGMLPDLATPLHSLSALAWITAFGLFVIVYAPFLLSPKSGES